MKTPQIAPLAGMSPLGLPSIPPLDETAEAIARRRRELQARRGAAPLPEGGLFDEAARNQLDLFG